MSGRSTPNILCEELSKYEFLSSDLNCQGGKSVVSTYINIRSGKKVIIKTVVLSEENDDYNEVNILKALVGVPGMCQYIEHFTDDERLYIVMDKIDGEDFFDFVINNRIPSKHRKLIYRLLFALIANLHDNGIIHCDIKPSNLIIKQTINDDGKYQYQMWLIDFGLSKFAVDAPTATVGGTWQYLSPEALNLNPSTYADDVWAAAVTIFGVEHLSMPFVASPAADNGQIDALYINNVKSYNIVWPPVTSTHQQLVRSLMELLLVPADKRATAYQVLSSSIFNKRKLSAQITESTHFITNKKRKLLNV